MDAIPYTQLAKGTLLIASPDIDEGAYFRSVIILCEHTPGGSFGIMINKPMEIELPDDLINWKQRMNRNVEIRSGGPIQPNQLMLLHGSDKMAEQTLKVCEGVYLGGDLQFLQEIIAEAEGPQVRLCFGYSVWGTGQLEREFLSGRWFLHPGSARYVFDIPVDKVWQTTLREMGGKYATLSMIPEDLSLN